MKTFRRVAWILLAAGLMAIVVLPLVVPFQSSGTVSFRDAGGQFIRVSDIDVHVDSRDYTGACACYNTGEEPLIILMHGFGASTFSWRDVIDDLSGFGEVVAYDRPGFGFTERVTTWAGENPYGTLGNFAIINGLIDEFAEGRPVVLVGHSAGGELAANFVVENPSRVQGLVLVDAAIFTTGGSPSWLTPVFALPQFDTIGPLLVSGIATSGDDLLRQSFVDQALLTPAVYDGYHAPLKVGGWERGFWEFAKAPRLEGVADRLNEITIPTLIITGDSDTVVPTSDATLLHDAIAGSERAVISNAGHLPHEEKPAAFLAALENWLPAGFGATSR